MRILTPKEAESFLKIDEQTATAIAENIEKAVKEGSPITINGMTIGPNTIRNERRADNDKRSD